LKASRCVKRVDGRGDRSWTAAQTPEEHERTRQVVRDFEATDGPKLQKKLEEYATQRARCVALAAFCLPATASTSYIEEFWDEAYLLQDEPTVLALKCVIMPV
jgi:carnitine O-acetyltransferase